MGRNFVLSLIGLSIFGLIGCQLVSKNELAFPECAIAPSTGDQIVLMPHHLLVESIIKDMYESLAVNDWENVVIVSPDHFYAGKSHISPATEEEHGFTVHRDFVKDFWPEANVEGYMIKTNATEAEITDFVKTLVNNTSTLFVFSVDFSHYLPGDVAKIHDLRSIDIIRTGDLTSFLGEGTGTIEVDSPKTIEVMLRLLDAQNQKMLIQRNTNPALDTGIKTFDNTTHVFACSGASQAVPLGTSTSSADISTRTLHTTMYFAHPKEWYAGKTEEDRYLYGYDEVFFDQAGKTIGTTGTMLTKDTVIVKDIFTGTEQKFEFDYF
ncbi:MAG: AmmeMemoRadiSam system protein B [Candidatus Gracilibacteria bacterium]